MHKVVNTGVVTVAMLTFAHASPVQAQHSSAARPHPEVLPEEDLEEVTVTAARIESPACRTAKSVTVITRAQIEKASVRSVEELLAAVAGIDVMQRGGHGVQADVSIRGGSADQTAVLLNGVNLTSPHTGHYSFDLPLNLSDIERIEVIYGPSALVYGSGAFSGGINIITRKDIDTRLSAGAQAGMHALHEADVRAAAPLGPTRNSLSAGYKASEGYTPHSDYNLLNMLWQTRWEMREHARIDMLLGCNNKRYGANTFYSAAYPDQYEQTAAYAGTLQGVFTGAANALRFLPSLYWNRHYDRFDLIRNTDTGRNYHRGDTYGTNLVLQYTSPLGVTAAATEWRREVIASSKLGKPLAEAQGHYTRYDGRTVTGLTLEHTLDRPLFAVSAGVLVTHSTLISRLQACPSVSASVRPLGACSPLRIHASWSRSVRMPTFTDLYYTTETHVANETLRPERSEAVDLGLRFSRPFVSAYLTAFLMWGRDVIDWVRESPDDRWASWNLTEIDKRGIEAGFTLRPGTYWPALRETVFSAAYARMTQTCNTRGLESRYSLNYLRDKVTLHLAHPVCPRLSAGWNFRFQQRMGVFSRYENGIAAGLQPYPAFSVLDLRLNYTLRQWNVFLNINNLYDTHYYDIGNVPQAGFWMTAGVAFRLE
jgi:iron complex outermembrane receptor protein